MFKLEWLIGGFPYLDLFDFNESLIEVVNDIFSWTLTAGFWSFCWDGMWNFWAYIEAFYTEGFKIKILSNNKDFWERFFLELFVFRCKALILNCGANGRDYQLGFCSLLYENFSEASKIIITKELTQNTRFVNDFRCMEILFSSLSNQIQIKNIAKTYFS